MFNMGIQEVVLNLFGFILFLAIPIILLVVFRKAVLWHFKIDKIVNLLEEINSGQNKS
ncbi:MAG: hypothetical protein GY863_10060 [bacterium]|nr:hypothetical protein [bacterium]